MLSMSASGSTLMISPSRSQKLVGCFGNGVASECDPGLFGPRDGGSGEIVRGSYTYVRNRQ